MVCAKLLFIMMGSRFSVFLSGFYWSSNDQYFAKLSLQLVFGDNKYAYFSSIGVFSHEYWNCGQGKLREAVFTSFWFAERL